AVLPLNEGAVGVRWARLRAFSQLLDCMLGVNGSSRLRMETKPAIETARQRLRRQDCALLVIDIQEKLLPPIHERERLVRNTQLLLRLAQILDLPIVATTQYARGLGGVVPEIASLLPSQAASDKLEFSCFNDQTFCGAVKARAKNRNTLLLCGMETHIC